MRIGTPFRAAQMMFAALSAAMVLTGPQRIEALGKIGQYKSRGKGRGTPSKVFGNPPGRYMPHQGARECARRLAAMPKSLRA